MCVTVQVSVLDPRLRQALLHRLDRMDGVYVPAESADGTGSFSAAPGGRIVVVLATETDAAECQALCDGGAEVIVLTPITRMTDRSRYLEAGAADYLAMDVRGEELESAIRRLTPHGS